MNDETNKKDYLKETEAYLSQFDSLSERLEKDQSRSGNRSEQTASASSQTTASRAKRNSAKGKLENAENGFAEFVAALILAHRRLHPAKSDCPKARKERRKAAVREASAPRAAAPASATVAAASPARRADDRTRIISKEEMAAGEVSAARSGSERPLTKAELKRAKRQAKKAKKAGRKRHTFRNIILAILALGICCCLAVGIWVLRIVKDTPDINPGNIYDLLSENSIIYDDDGEVLEYIYDSVVGLRTNLSYNEIPKQLIDCFICTEDKTFWTHHGFNIIRILGAIKESLVSGDPISGTSTITQQLARNLYLTETKSKHSYVRKVQEAYYTLVLERALSKEQIIEAYLNTVYLGQNSNGIYAAAQTYFSKEVKDLTLGECALLATIPKNPTKYSPIATYVTKNIKDISLYDVIYQDSTYTTVYKADYRDRMNLILYNLEDQGLIDHATRQAAWDEDLRASIKPSKERTTTISSYFADYVTSNVITDLCAEYGYTTAEARSMLQTGGLRIYSTIDVDMQQKADDIFADASNFPTLVNMVKDPQGNILNKDNNVLLYNLDTYFDKDGSFVLTPDDYAMNADGSMTVYRGKRLNIYEVSSNGEKSVQVEFKYLYSEADGSFYQINGGVLNIPAKYMSRDEQRNLVISKAFFQDYDWLTKRSDGSYALSSDHYTLRQKTIQPQSSMVITDYRTGQIKVMVGGRSTSGKLLYNRSLSTRQPGSSIKPFTVYGAALNRSFLLVNALSEKDFDTIANLIGNDATNTVRIALEAAESESDARKEAQKEAIREMKAAGLWDESILGGLTEAAYVDACGAISYREVLESAGITLWTAGSILDDSVTLNEIGEVWPKNSYNYYIGLCTLRFSLEQSINVNAVRIQSDIGVDCSLDYAQKFGITSFVTDPNASSNDRNPSALGLGGMINGVSTLEMASAYGTYPNGGVYQAPICYTKVTNKSGDILLEKKSESTVACDESVAYLMTNLLHSVVTNGIGSPASIGAMPVGGKTGTTSDRYDIWFSGFTPYYSASLWIGNDTNVELSSSSTAAARLWSKVMKAVHADLPVTAFAEAPEDTFVTVSIDTQSGLRPGPNSADDYRQNNIRSEIFYKDTEPQVYEVDDSHVYVEICSDSGFLATPDCTNTFTALRVNHPEDSNILYAAKKLPDDFCLPLSYTFPHTVLNANGQLVDENGNPATVVRDSEGNLTEAYILSTEKGEPKEDGTEGEIVQVRTELFLYPDSLHLDYEVVENTRYASIKWQLPQEVVDDIYDTYGTMTTYTVRDYGYANPRYYCYLHNPDPVFDFPINPYVVLSPDYTVPDSIRRYVDEEFEEYVGDQIASGDLEYLPYSERMEDPYSHIPSWLRPQISPADGDEE